MINAQDASAESMSTEQVLEAKIVLYNQFTNNTGTLLSLPSGQASATAKFVGYPGTTTKVTITMTLQKQGF